MEGEEYKSVNETSNPMAPRKALQYIGTALPRIIHAIATATKTAPCYFAKADIQDGFWRVFIKPEGRWNFAYTLPQRTPDDPVHIVVPNSTQMGWVESIYVFCAASETARDIGEVLLREDSLPAHKLEEVILPKVVQSPITESFDPATFLQMLEVYVDDFIAIAQATNIETLRHVT